MKVLTPARRDRNVELVSTRTPRTQERSAARDRRIPRPGPARPGGARAGGGDRARRTRPRQPGAHRGRTGRPVRGGPLGAARGGEGAGRQGTAGEPDQRRDPGAPAGVVEPARSGRAALAVLRGRQPGGHPGPGRSAGRAGTGRGPAGRRVGYPGPARGDRRVPERAVGDGRGAGRVHRGRPGLPPGRVRGLPERSAALHPRRGQRGARRDPPAAHALGRAQPRDAAHPSAGGRGHPARSSPEGGGRDARDRRGRPRRPDAGSSR